MLLPPSHSIWDMDCSAHMRNGLKRPQNMPALLTSKLELGACAFSLTLRIARACEYWHLV